MAIVLMCVRVHCVVCEIDAVLYYVTELMSCIDTSRKTHHVEA